MVAHVNERRQMVGVAARGCAVKRDVDAHERVVRAELVADIALDVREAWREHAILEATVLDGDELAVVAESCLQLDLVRRSNRAIAIVADYSLPMYGTVRVARYVCVREVEATHVARLRG